MASTDNDIKPVTSWKLWRQDNDIKIEYRQYKQDKFIEIRASTKIESSLSGFLLFIEDANNTPNWLENASYSRFIEKLSPTEHIFITVFDGFWPIHARDIVIRSKYQQNDDLSVKIFVQDASQFQKKQTNIIRMELLSGQWLVTPMYTEKPWIQVSYTFSVDPKGSIPRWLNKKLALAGIWQTMHNLRTQVPNSIYQHQTHSYIEEPISPLFTQ